MDGIGRVKGKIQKGKDPISPVHLKKIARVVGKESDWEFMMFTCILFMFRTLLRVSHMVWSNHTLTCSDVKFNKNGMLVAIRSSKTKGKGETVSFLPVVKAGDNDLCAVTWLKCFLKKFPREGKEVLFSLNGKKFTYNMFSEKLRILLDRAKVVGDFASHSLRRGGATHMSMSGCTVPEVKGRGLWKSDCMYRYNY